MIILDTNIISALMQKEPNHLVMDWLDGCPSESLWLTSVTLYESYAGIEKLEPGKRRSHLENALAQAIANTFDGRILSFDSPAAKEASILYGQRLRAGKPVDVRDTMIAGIALAHRAAIATRNTRDFDDLNLTLINPWNNRIAY